MTFTAFGFRVGSLDTATLSISALERKRTLYPKGRMRLMSGFGLDANGHELLEDRFGLGFESFVLLDEVAIEACHRLRITLGEEVGPIEMEDLGPSAFKFGPWEYWD